MQENCRILESQWKVEVGCVRKYLNHVWGKRITFLLHKKAASKGRKSAVVPVPWQLTSWGAWGLYWGDVGLFNR